MDEIVDELAKEPSVAAAYELWYLLREEVLRTYKDELPERLPLSQQKEFKRVKNLVIEEAVKLGEYSEVFAAGDDSQPKGEDNDTASEQKYSYAQYKAAKQILENPSSTQEQTSKAVEWLAKLADAGLDCAQYTLGKLYRDGWPVSQDKLKAVIWFTQAAEQGNEYAMYALSKIHQDENNLNAAMSWYRRSAELGNPFAQYRLGKLLLNGEGVERDADSAIRWLTESAQQGNQYAQYALGKLYLIGKDVPQDKDAAVCWFSMAANQGNEYAQYFLDRLNASPALLTNATRLLRHMGNIFREQALPPSGGICFVDSKLRRKMQEKKAAMGHKRDDHEEQVQQQQRL